MTPPQGRRENALSHAEEPLGKALAPHQTRNLATAKSGILPMAVTPASILMVDDTPANLLALEAILEPLGHTLVRANGGEEALRQLLFHDFAVILMDVQMPVLDGFKTAKLIKERERSQHIPIIFITAISRDDEHIFRGYAQGAVDYLLKPVEPHILRCKVSVFVDLFRKNEEVKRQGELLRLQEREAAEKQHLYEMERQARREAETAIRAREDILAVVSHDLRNPLNSICASTTLLARYLEGVADKRVQRHLSAIDYSVERMSRLIGDLLDLSRIEGSRLVLQREVQALSQIVLQTVEMLEPVAAGKRQQILTEVAPDALELAVYCDKERIIQVVSNLLGNAIKFSGEDSLIRVTVDSLPGRLRVRVQDQGPGIAPDALPHIFERYWQGPGHIPGIGLGLAIAKGLIDAHGGRIGAQSAGGTGTEFFFELSLA